MKSSLQRFARATAMVAMLALGYAGAQQNPKRCLMWRAVNGNNVVYLLGSIHIGSKDMYPLPKVVENAYKDSKVLVVEVDLKKVDMASMQGEVMQRGMYSPPDNLWKHVKASTKEHILKFCSKYKDQIAANPEVVSMMKPWMASVSLSVVPMTAAGMDPQAGIDMHFMDMAEGNAHPKRVEQVETAAFQFDLLSSLPASLSDDWLNYTIGQGDRATDDDTKIAKLWKQGDANQIAQVMLDTPKSLAGFQRKLLQDRNPHMADIAEKYLKGGGPCFFVVGAAHLVGTEGVVAILQKRGYKVTQVSAAESAL